VDAHGWILVFVTAWSVCLLDPFDFLVQCCFCQVGFLLLLGDLRAGDFSAGGRRWWLFWFSLFLVLNYSLCLVGGGVLHLVRRMAGACGCWPCDQDVFILVRVSTGLCCLFRPGTCEPGRPLQVV